MKTIRSVLTGLARSPLKTTLTLLTVGLGVGVLVFALSISGAFTRLMELERESGGLVIMVANATYATESGELEIARPPIFDGEVLSVLQSDVAGVHAAAPIATSLRGGFGGAMLSELVAEGSTYRIRAVVSTSEKYGDALGLEMAAGLFFSADDVEKGSRSAVLSESLAKVLFGSAEAAVGKTLAPPSRSQGGVVVAAAGPGGTEGQRAPERRAFVMPTFTVTGVFRDPGELFRSSYGVGDLILPHTALLPQGVNTALAQRFNYSLLAVNVRGATFSAAEAQIRSALASHYGEDTPVHVWEGTPRGETAALAEARRTVATFSLVVNLLGFVLLITGSIGILSIMLVEILGRGREIALERALGASRGAILREYFYRSVLVSALAASVGVILALVFARPLQDLLVPIFRGVSEADLGGSVVGPGPVAVGVGVSLVVGGVFGIFPVLPALQTSLAEGMREGQG